MESDVENLIIMWGNMTSFWSYCEIVLVIGRIPLEFCTNISKIGKLDLLIFFRVQENPSKTLGSIFHEF